MLNLYGSELCPKIGFAISGVIPLSSNTILTAGLMRESTRAVGVREVAVRQAAGGKYVINSLTQL
jgi:hypothetical protein